MTKVYLALTKKHLGSIHKGLKGEEKVAQVGLLPGARDAKMYQCATNVCVQKILSRVNFLQNFTLFRGESE